MNVSEKKRQANEEERRDTRIGCVVFVKQRETKRRIRRRREVGKKEADCMTIASLTDRRESRHKRVGSGNRIGRERSRAVTHPKIKSSLQLRIHDDERREDWVRRSATSRSFRKE